MGLGAFRHPCADTRREGLVVGFAAAPSPSPWSGSLTALCGLLETADRSAIRGSAGRAAP